MSLDVGRHMLVMRVSRRQSGVVWMREIVIPEKPFLSTIDFVTICGDQPGREIQFFAQAKSNAIREDDFAFASSRKRTIRPNNNCCLHYLGTVECIRDKAAVLRQRRKWRVAHAQ